MRLFINRQDAGQKLASALASYQKATETLVIALPRGGVVVGFEVAQFLQLPLDIFCPRKIGAPFNPEFAIGAITETGDGVFSKDVIQHLGISQTELDALIEKEKKEAARRLAYFRKGLPPRQLQSKRVILVDDGLATGSTMRAAIKTAKAENAKEVIVAVPVAPPDTMKLIEKEADKTLSLYVPANFYAVGQFYEFFDQTTDDEVVDLLNRMIKTQV